MKAKKNPGMTFERFIEAVMACEIVLRNYYYYRKPKNYFPEKISHSLDFDHFLCFFWTLNPILAFVFTHHVQILLYRK